MLKFNSHQVGPPAVSSAAKPCVVQGLLMAANSCFFMNARQNLELADSTSLPAPVNCMCQSSCVLDHAHPTQLGPASAMGNVVGGLLPQSTIQLPPDPLSQVLLFTRSEGCFPRSMLLLPCRSVATGARAWAQPKSSSRLLGPKATRDLFTSSYIAPYTTTAHQPAHVSRTRGLRWRPMPHRKYVGCPWASRL